MEQLGPMPKQQPMVKQPPPTPEEQLLNKLSTLLPEWQPRCRAVFDQLVADALAGHRCPTNGDLRNDGHLAVSVALDMLCEIRVIRLEVYAKNFRVARIAIGPHAGKHTAEKYVGPPYFARGARSHEVAGARAPG